MGVSVKCCFCRYCQYIFRALLGFFYYKIVHMKFGVYIRGFSKSLDSKKVGTHLQVLTCNIEMVSVLFIYRYK